MDFDFGPDGSLYLIEWGSGFGGDNADSGIYRIDYTAGDRKPIAKATATPDNGPAPLQVQFSSEGSNDPEGTDLTFAWDFDNNGTVDSTEANPTHTYTQPGSYNAVLKVTDEGGLSAVNNVLVVVGNTRPEVTIEFPENGQFAAFGDKVPFKISVTDAEDGSTGSGINCADVTLTVQLGHDQHAHGLSQQNACEGTFDTLLTTGHGDTANVFTVVDATYTDKGAAGSAPLTGRAEAILPPKRKQAEFFTAMSGIQTEDTADTGGGKNIGFIENGDWVSYDPVNLKDIRAINFRVASGGAGGNIEVRLDSPTGLLVGSVAVANTGGWQNWANVSLPLTNPPGGTHAMYLVFTNPTPERGRPVQRQLVRGDRQGRRGHRGPTGLGRRGPEDRRRAARRALHRHRDRLRCRAGRPAQLQVGLRRRRHQRRHLDPAEPDVHVPARGHVQRDADRDRRGRRARLVLRAGRGDRARQLPGEQPAVGRVRRQLAGHQPLAGDPARQHAAADRLERVAALPDRQRLALPGGHERTEHRRPGPAER